MIEQPRGERRAETARRHDDSDLVDDDAPPTPDKVGRSGGNLQRDVATADPDKRVRDPQAGDNLHKEQEREHHGE